MEPSIPLFTLDENWGHRTVSAAKQVFTERFDSRFKKEGIVFSSHTYSITVKAEDVDEKTSRFLDFFGTTAGQIERYRLLGSQFLVTCRDHQEKLLSGGSSNFFLLTMGDEKVAKDLSNAFVAIVSVDRSQRGKPAKLHACLYEFGYDRLYLGDKRRIFSRASSSDVEEELDRTARTMPTGRLKLSIEGANARRASNEFDDTAASTAKAWELTQHQMAWERELKRREKQ